MKFTESGKGWADMRTLLKGGTVVSGNGTREADLVTDGEKIVAVERRYRGKFDRAVNVRDCLLFPGFIDAQTRFDADIGGATTADNFYTGSKAALCGGVTTVLDAARPKAGETLRAALERQRAKADAQTFCDYALHMALPVWNGDIQAELPGIFAQGVSSFLLSTDAPGDRQLYEMLRTLRAYGGTCAIECGNQAVSDALAAEAGDVSPASYPLTNPPALEAEGAARALRIARVAGAPVVIRRVSASETLSEVERARRRGQAAYAETCPQYLLLDESAYRTDAAPLYVCKPPLRERPNQGALWRGLRRGLVQLVSSGHCAFTEVQKRAGTRVPPGLPGVQELAELLYSYGAAERRLSVPDVCRILCESPAKIYGLWPRKGRLAPGADADIVVYDPGDSHVISARNRASAAGYTPYEGFPTAGGVRQVWLRGTLTVDGGRFLPVTPKGLYLRRGRMGRS